MFAIFFLWSSSDSFYSCLDCYACVQVCPAGVNAGKVSQISREYANDVTEMFRKIGIKEIITVDPHTYDLLKNHYPDYVSGFDFRVTHYLDFLKNQIHPWLIYLP